MTESENSLTSGEEREDDEIEESEELTSSDEPIEQRILPSRTNRGARMNFLLSNARLIADSRADKGYKRLFSDGETSDSMNDSEAYSSESNSASDSFDSDFDDEAKGKLPPPLSPPSDNSSAEEGNAKRRVRKVPKRFRGARATAGEARRSQDPAAEQLANSEPTVVLRPSDHPENLPRERPKRGSTAAPTSVAEPSPEQGRLTRVEKKVELLAERRKRVSQNVRKSPVADAPIEKRQRKPRSNSTSNQTQGERMERAMQMREHNLAVLAAESEWNEEDAAVTQNAKKSIREKWPFYFYEPSGYRRVEKAEWVEKYGTTTLYMLPMCGAEYTTLFPTSMAQSASPVEALTRRRLECALETREAPHIGGARSRYQYHYSQEPLPQQATISSKHLVPYPLRFGTRAGTPARPAKRVGMFATDGKIKFAQKSKAASPTSGLLGCTGPYREPFTGLFYSTPSQYDDISRALRRIREFWRMEGYPPAWASLWGDLGELSTQRSLRWALMPFLVKVAREVRGEI
ncbi:hypothetical protein XU18_1668 [Perkinsela sp. CCAP 1560/4]|nr:hypothetical protein XU18_1668 [Perkinsela sp. CCAP 1560/4]|eukprot:KNH07667.1 hypothetical protein XU18_1668 [Perkinsela sp. CCAP 1560/4]